MNVGDLIKNIENEEKQDASNTFAKSPWIGFKALLNLIIFTTFFLSAVFFLTEAFKGMLLAAIIIAALRGILKAIFLLPGLKQLSSNKKSELYESDGQKITTAQKIFTGIFYASCLCAGFSYFIILAASITSLIGECSQGGICNSWQTDLAISLSAIVSVMLTLRLMISLKNFLTDKTLWENTDVNHKKYSVKDFGIKDHWKHLTHADVKTEDKLKSFCVLLFTILGALAAAVFFVSLYYLLAHHIGTLGFKWLADPAISIPLFTASIFARGMLFLRTAITFFGKVMGELVFNLLKQTKNGILIILCGLSGQFKRAKILYKNEDNILKTTLKFLVDIAKFVGNTLKLTLFAIGILCSYLLFCPAHEYVKKPAGNAFSAIKHTLKTGFICALFVGNLATNFVQAAPGTHALLGFTQGLTSSATAFKNCSELMEGNHHQPQDNELNG